MNIKHYLSNTLLVLVISLQAISGSAIGGSRSSWEYENQPDEDYVEGEKWAEIELKIPPYPDDDDLMELHLDNPDNRFKYYIDEKSLSFSKKDYVLRYTMVIESRRGTRNVFYEGMRCSTKEYKTYAFGAGKGKLRLRKKPEWKVVGGARHTRYRERMMEDFFCEWGLPRQLGIIIDRIKYPTSSVDMDG